MSKIYRKSFLITFLYILFFESSFGQPIINFYLSSLIPESKSSNFSEITETHEVYVPHKDKPTIFYIHKQFNSSGKIKVEVKKNSVGGKTGETTWEYTSDGKLRKKTSLSFMNMKGWISESTEIIYNDSTGNVEGITNSFENKIRYRAQINCNEKGEPMEVRVVNGNGILTSIERLMRIPANNCLRVLCFNENEQFRTSYNYPIDYSKPLPKNSIKQEFNEQGDVIIEMLSQNSKINQGYYFEYEYDSRQNWTEKRTYQCTISSKGKPKNNKLEYRILRQINY